MDNSNIAPPTHQISKKKVLLLYLIVSFFLIFEMAIQVSPSVMSTQLMHDLNMSAFGLGMMSGVYFYTYTAMQIPSGLLLDRYNPRMIITISILVCTLGSLLFSFATNIYTASFARLLTGAGSAFAFVSVLVVSADLFKSRYFAAITGVTQMLGALGAMMGQIPVSLLVHTAGWRTSSLVFSAIGIVLAILVWNLLNYKRPTIQLGQRTNSNSVGSKIKNILSQPQTWFIALYSCLLWAPMSSFASLWGVPYLTFVDHIEPIEAAFLCSLMWLGVAAGSPIVGIAATLINNRVLPLIITSAVGMTAFGLLLNFNFSVTMIGILMFLAGVSCAGQSLCFTLTKENNQDSVRGTAMAFNNMAVVISGALFQPIIGKIIDSNQQGPTLYHASDYQNGAYAILIAYIASLVIAVFFIKEPKQLKLVLKEATVPS